MLGVICLLYISCIYSIGKYYLNNAHWAKADPDTDYDTGSGIMGKKTEEEKVVPLIHACATLWHETPNEMEQLLKSVFRYQTLLIRCIEAYNYMLLK